MLIYNEWLREFRMGERFGRNTEWFARNGEQNAERFAQNDWNGERNTERFAWNDSNR
jgi:hypothetical protein